jgi:hypothetical protein
MSVKQYCDALARVRDLPPAKYKKAGLGDPVARVRMTERGLEAVAWAGASSLRGVIYVHE